MARKKLIKRGQNKVMRQTRSIPVEDTNGNKSILKATVIGVDTKKIRKEQSHAIIDDPSTMGFTSGIVKPPLSQHELSVLSEYSSELGPNIDAMVIGVEGFGQKAVLKDMPEAVAEKYKTEIGVERSWIETHIINHPNSEGSLRTLRKLLMRDKENTGNSYIELVPSLKEGKYSSYNKVDASTIYITKADKTFTRVTVNYVNAGFQLKQKTFLKRLRRFVQVVGNKKIYFKEFRDPRHIDARTGEVLRLRSNGKGDKVPVDGEGNEVNKKYLARELFHQKLPTARKTPYGLPRFTGNIIGIKGSRSSEEANILTLQNNNVPSMAIMVSGGMLTDGSIERIQEFVDTSIKGDLNYSKFLILEGESAHDGLSGASNMKIEIKPLTNDQHSDALWSDYDEKNNVKTRRSFRQPQALVGAAEKINKDEALTSEILTEKYVYNPEREDIDEDWNSILVHQGIRFFCIKGNTPNVTNEEVLVKILSGAEKTGGVTPRISHMILEEILNRKLPAIKEDDPDFNPDLPFSISIGRLARGMARSNPEGTMAPTGQSEGDKGENNDPNAAEKLFLEHMEEILDVEAFGEFKKDYHKHG